MNIELIFTICAVALVTFFIAWVGVRFILIPRDKAKAEDFSSSFTPDDAILDDYEALLIENQSLRNELYLLRKKLQEHEVPS